MAGWSRVNDGSVVDCAKTPRRKFKPSGFWVQLDLARPEESGVGAERKRVRQTEAETDKYRCWFERLLGSFLKEICTGQSYRSIPPMLGDERYVDLFKLFLAVRDKGGYDAVSANGLWGSVTEEIGLSGKVYPAVKLLYCKYLEVLERWLVKTVEKRGSGGSSSISRAGLGDSEGLMVLEAEFKVFLSEISDLKKKDEEHPHFDLTVNSASKSVVGDSCEGKTCVDGDRYLGLAGSLNLRSSGKMHNDNEVESVMANPDGRKEIDNATFLDPGMVEEERSGCKRKRENMLGMLNWVNAIAKNPGQTVIPERSKWKAYADDAPWKQVLLVRETLFLRRDLDLNTEQLAFQKWQKMHPSMYDDQLGSSYNLRERFKSRRRLLSEGQTCSGSSSPGSQSDLDNSQNPISTGISHIDMVDSWDLKRIPLGPNFQAEIPEWTEVPYESDSKWLGSKIWPLEKTEHRSLIERDPIGKGRPNSCGCQTPDSIECVKFHTAEKRFKVKLELGSAFHHWKFNKMGEEVALSWEKDEEKKFESIVRANPRLLGKRFDHMRRSFPAKSRENLVSYYFNVFVLRRRAFQNRFTPADVNSDNDDDDDSGSKGSEHETLKRPGSIFYSPNKPRSNSR